MSSRIGQKNQDYEIYQTDNNEKFTYRIGKAFLEECLSKGEFYAIFRFEIPSVRVHSSFDGSGIALQSSEGKSAIEKTKSQLEQASHMKLVEKNIWSKRIRQNANQK